MRLAAAMRRGKYVQGYSQTQAREREADLPHQKIPSFEEIQNTELHHTGQTWCPSLSVGNTTGYATLAFLHPGDADTDSNTPEQTVESNLNRLPLGASWLSCPL